MNSIKQWFRSGDSAIWLSAAAVSASLIIVVGLMLQIASNGLAHFWPARVAELSYQLGEEQTVTLVGEIRDRETVPLHRLLNSGQWMADQATPTQQRLLLKIGNRDINGLDFRWVFGGNLVDTTYPPALLVIERLEWGNFYGYLQALQQADEPPLLGQAAQLGLAESIDRAVRLRQQIHQIEQRDIGQINYQMERLRLRQRRFELDQALTAEIQAELDASRQLLDQRYQQLQQQLAKQYRDIRRDKLVLVDANGTEKTILLAKVVRAYFPNRFTLVEQLGFYFSKAWEFVSEAPREANTEGGIFPAIFGTVVMVLIMSVLVTPFGILAAVYLHEYARQGLITRTVRIAVNNLAGVPSIVYGVFGLGFFVYFLGGNIDQLFFSEALPAPTFGTPGLLWSSLTLALLTLPVVIVSTEEGLSRVPRAVREGSLALGATKAETLWRVVLPMSSPAMMTGMILAVARAAGEVAPLMLVGVVKLAPTLPVDWNMPFLHLERKFMHMGFHIYDVGFQSPNVEAARPLVYATALLLVVVIVVMNLAAISIRNNLREKYRALEQ